MRKKGIKNYSEEKAKAKELFIQKGYSPNQIHKFFQQNQAIYRVPNLRTIQGWCGGNTKENWRKQRKEIRESSWSAAISVKNMLPHFLKMLEENPAPSTVDALKKVVSTMKQLEQTVDYVGVMLQLLEMQAVYYRHAGASAVFLEEFGDLMPGLIGYIYNKYGDK